MSQLGRFRKLHGFVTAEAKGMKGKRPEARAVC